MKRLLIFLCLLAVAAPAAHAQDKPKVEFRDGDRVAFVGNEFFERDQDRGYIETDLTTRFPDKNITFRNLGYSGDTVRADARNLCAGWELFGPADQGFDRLKNLIEHIKPTLVFVAYGMNESFDGPAGLDSFTQGLNRMLDMLSAGGARIVLISPIRHEDLGKPLPDPAEHNKDIRLYTDAMETVAQQRGYPFIDLYQALSDGPKENLTFDGIHLTPFGYWRCAAVLEQAMGYAPRHWDVNIDAKAAKAEAVGTKIDGLTANDHEVRFRSTDEMLPLAEPPANG
ncbi:MAG TPA: SGNH/GDSL hydrolase family protein, partial [Urbifossiella sp.]